MENNSILRVSSFKSDLSGHGGNRRTAQINELLESANFAINDANDQKSTRLERYIYGINIWRKNNFRYLQDFRTLGTWGDLYVKYENAFKQHSGSKTFLWESTSNQIISYLAKDNQYKIIAMPQNIESLVRGKDDICTFKSILENLEKEIIHLAKSDAIFCISREEQWLLKLLGINADFLPYYPPKQIVDELLDIRQSRISSEKRKFLILGTANNPPTFLGMIEQIKILEKVRKEIEFEVDIAGYGTENLREYCTDSSINLLGTVSPSQLHSLMKSAIAVLIYQNAGVGALTRIPEMLIAGIPVIANSNACRSAYNYDGIYCYDDDYELIELMKNNLDVPKVLPRPTESERRFIDYFNAII
jgi:hypothetical protein